MPIVSPEERVALRQKLEGYQKNLQDSKTQQARLDEQRKGIEQRKAEVVEKMLPLLGVTKVEEVETKLSDTYIKLHQACQDIDKRMASLNPSTDSGDFSSVEIPTHA